MCSRLPVRFWTVRVIALVLAAACAIRLVWPQWIASFLRPAADDGDGLDTSGVALVLLALTHPMAAVVGQHPRHGSAA